MRNVSSVGPGLLEPVRLKISETIFRLKEVCRISNRHDNLCVFFGFFGFYLEPVLEVALVSDEFYFAQVWP
jgi:hypothetical protein